jgi:hypothetical protein
MKTQTKHTPGPWEIGSINKKDKNLYWSAVFTPKNTGKFHTPRAGEALGVDREECEANAHLIAAAPDLLEALRLLLEASDGLNGESEWLDERLNAARAAIAKAEGAQ